MLDVAAWEALPALVRSHQLHGFVTSATGRALASSALRTIEHQLKRRDALVWELQVAQVRPVASCMPLSGGYSRSVVSYGCKTFVREPGVSLWSTSLWGLSCGASPVLAVVLACMKGAGASPLRVE